MSNFEASLVVNASASLQNWIEASQKVVYEKRHLSLQQIKELSGECLLLFEEGEKIAFCRSFLALCICAISSEENAVLEHEEFFLLLEKLLSLPKEPLIHCYQKVLLNLLHVEIKLFPEKNLPMQKIPSLAQKAEETILLGILGALSKDEHVTQQFLANAESFLDFFDKEGFFPKSIWTQEEEFVLEESYHLFALLFKLAHHASQSEVFQKMAEMMVKLQEEAAAGSFSFLHFYEALFSHLELKQNQKSSSETLSSFPFQKTLGFGSFFSSSYSLFCSVSGKNSSFACLKKGKVELVAIGPQRPPLGKMNEFGIFREMLCQERAFREVVCKSGKDEMLFEGFSKIAPFFTSSGKSSDKWIQIACRAKKEGALFLISQNSFEENSDLELALFFKADKAIVDQKYHLLPGSLDRYVGKATEVCFATGKDFLKVAIDSQEMMQIIPLAGQNHFWGANFLLATSLSLEPSLSIHFS